MSRGFACYFFICTELTQLCSFFRFPDLHMLGGIKRFAHRENYNSELYNKSYMFIFETNMYIKHYLSDPCVRCSSHKSPPSICLHAGFKCGATSHLSKHRNQKQADCLRLLTYIDRWA